MFLPYHSLIEAVAFHDVGKAATGFQKSLEPDQGYWGHRHEIVSAAFATALGVSDEVVFAIITHHKTLPPDFVTVENCLPQEEIPFTNNMKGVWKDMAKEWYANLELFSYEWRLICDSISRQDLYIDTTNKNNLLSPLSESVQKWLRRDIQTKVFTYEQREYVSLLRGLMMSSDHIASALSSDSTIPNPVVPNIPLSFENHDPRGFQISMSKYKGNVQLKAPTGSGKTKAALLWSQNNRKQNGRLFYALPTTASINAMYRNLHKDFPAEIVGLLPSRTVSSLYSMFETDESNNLDDRTRQNKARTLASLVREMYFPIRVCTPHQILRYTLQGRGWEAMLSEFPHSTFIFDEIHAYNPKLTGLIIATAKYLTKHNAKVMFLTATLPTFLKKILESQIDIGFVEPSYDITSDKRILEQKRHIIEPIDGSVLDEKNILKIVNMAKENVGSISVVCNHVNTAQQVYKDIKSRVNNTVLIHSRFNRHDRNRIENNLMFKELPKILVATQVVEVSLDIDFQQGFTEPAPIDAIVQRMGRVNRKGLTTPVKPNIYIFSDQYGGSIPYTKDMRDSSFKKLINLPKPLSEEDLGSAVDAVYGNGYVDDDLNDYDKGLNYKPLREFERYLKAGTNEDWVDIVIEANEGTVDILPEYMQQGYNDLKAEKKPIAANDLLVPVGRWALPFLMESGRLYQSDSEKNLLIAKCKYDYEIGLDFGDIEDDSVI